MNRRNFLQAMVFAATAFFGRLVPVMAVTRGKLSPPLLKQARAIGKNLVQSKELSFEAMDSFVAKTNSANIMAVLFEIFKESIRQTNEDKRYFLEKLKKQNDIAEAMGWLQKP